MMFGLLFIVIGFFFLIFVNLLINIDYYNLEIVNFFMKIMVGWKDFVVVNYDLIIVLYNLIMGIIGLISVFGIVFFFVNEYKINLFMNGMVVFVIYLMVCILVIKGIINLNYLGINGFFVVIIIGLLVVEVN